LSYALGGAAEIAAAQDFSPPPPPNELRPSLAGEVHLGLVSPVRSGSMCPPRADCIFNGGGGIGGTLEWRYPQGLSVGLGYEGIFLAGHGVYELTVIQVLRATGGYRLLPQRRAHPYLTVGVGAYMIGNSFHYGAMGVSVDGAAGIELEVSHALATRLGLGLWMGTNGAFVSANDGVRRSGSPDVAMAITLQLGIVILQEH